MEDDVDISALTIEQYIALIPDDIKPGIVNPKLSDDVEFEVNANFMRELRRKIFSTDDEDAYDMHTVLEIVDLFHFYGVTHDAIMLRGFPITLKGRALRWKKRLPTGLWVIDKSTEALDPDKDPLERCLDKYNWVFHKEIKQLADEYEIKFGEKGQVLEEIWTKCKRARSEDKHWWYDYWYEDEEKNFICVSGKSNETLSLGRKNGPRFRKMIMEEMEETLRDDGEDFVDET
ncbi:hypothetical protein Tco_0323875 [Tanacetum coccineum]